MRILTVTRKFPDPQGCNRLPENTGTGPDRTGPDPGFALVRYHPNFQNDGIRHFDGLTVFIGIGFTGEENSNIYLNFIHTEQIATQTGALESQSNGISGGICPLCLH